jgi:hypothetical protein
MSDYAKIISLQAKLAERAKEQAEFSMDPLSEVLEVIVEAIRRMREMGATSDDLARFFSHIAYELRDKDGAG